MKSRKYKFRTNSPYKNEDANKVGRYLEKKFKGRVTAEKTEKIARDKNSPIHKYFEWDDTKAAYAHRLYQARSLINALYVVIDGEEPVRAYENVFVSEIDANEYVDIEDIAKVPTLQSQVLETAKRELIYWKLKYSRYDKFFRRIFSEISKLEKRSEQ